jgi:AcrR family transcriptional regulator
VPPVRTPGRRYGDKTPAERAAERRERLLGAALDAFATDGYANTSIEALCAAARVSTRDFYALFGSREALVIALHDDLNARALTAVGQAIAPVDPDDLEARARAGVRAYFDVVTSDRRWARIALVESVGVSPEAERHRQEAIGRFAQLLELETSRMAAAGVIPQRDFRLTAIALVGAINGLVNTWTADPDWDAHVDDVVDVAARLIVVAAR